MSGTLSTELTTITSEIGSLQTQITLEGPTDADATQQLDLSVELNGLQLDVELANNPGLSSEFNSDETQLANIRTELCFLHGTHILTERGEILVEDLTAGDRVMTPFGTAASMPIRWLGSQHYEGDSARFHQPILIRAGALGKGLPHRDLRLSGDHCMYLERRLVPAKLLVNGVTIIAERGHDVVDYINIELDAHNIVLAEGAPSETYLDCGNRDRFDNANETNAWLSTRQPRTDTAWADGTAFAPPLWNGAELTALINRLMPTSKNPQAA